MNDGRTTTYTGAWVYYTISSPCEPEDPGELKKAVILFIKSELAVYTGQHICIYKIFTKPFNTVQD